ncbi:hypothetical protein TNCV_2771671 [Trichonephila clavipes]|nr:hypothetical protein TNCV_2771671 [Trichonephila clavipes]
MTTTSQCLTLQLRLRSNTDMQPKVEGYLIRGITQCLKCTTTSIIRQPIATESHVAPSAGRITSLKIAVSKKVRIIPSASIARCIEVSVGITFQDGDRFNSCQEFYSQFGLAIHQNDHQARRRFIEWAQNEIAVVPDFHKRILFSDEAHFWLNGYVNKQNCRIGVKLIHKCMSKHRYIQKN